MGKAIGRFKVNEAFVNRRIYISEIKWHNSKRKTSEPVIREYCACAKFVEKKSIGTRQASIKKIIERHRDRETST